MNQAYAHPPRIDEQLTAYWQQLRAGRAVPREAEINPEALKDIWASCFLVSPKANGSFAYNYMGTQLVDAYGDDLSGKEITEKLLFPHPASLFHAFKDVAASGQPSTDESEFMNSRGRTIKYRSCLLPLAGPQGDGVGFILGGMKWKAY